jgi:hypothetical protein
LKNLVWLKNVKCSIFYVNKVVYMWLIIFSTTINAQALVPASESEDESDNGDNDSYIEAFPTESAEENEIHRKENPQDPCDRGLDTYNYEKSWYDKTQIYINSSFCEPALWFDNFFANDRVFAEGPAGTYVRWRNNFIYDEEDYFKFNTSLNISVELPGTQDMLRLTYENDNAEDIQDLAPGNTTDKTNTLGLQLKVLENIRSKITVTVSFSPSLRLRYRYTYPGFKDLTLRFTQQVERDQAVNSGRTLFEVEKPFEQRFLFRSTTQGEVSEAFDGVDWLQAFVVYQRINKKTSLSYESSVNGITEPYTIATDYGIALRLRKNFHRKWLFYEIAPALSWPITLDASRDNVIKDRRSRWSILFRFEVHFGNAHKKRYEDYN